MGLSTVEVDEALDNFSDTGEWWKRDGKETFKSSYRELIDKGFESQEALDFLECLYSAVSGEYGN